MKRFRFDTGHPISAFGSDGVQAAFICEPAGKSRTIAMTIAPGGHIGRHPAVTQQLFLVVRGKGWVSGGDSDREPITAGEGVLWTANEDHAAGSDRGMTAIIIEGDDLNTRS